MTTAPCYEPVEPVEPVIEPDPVEFDRSKVPDGPLADLFFDGRSGRGLTDAEWNEQDRRLMADPALWEALHGRPLEVPNAES